TTLTTFLSVNFNGTINSDSNATPRSLDVGLPGSSSITFNGAVGDAQSLASLTAQALSINLKGGSVNTTGDQTYMGGVLLNAAANATTLTGANVTFTSVVRSPTGGEDALTVNASGTTSFNGGAVGDGGQTLASLTTDAPGSTFLRTGVVVTTGDQSYGDNVTLGFNETLTSTNNGAISFGQTVDGNFTLAVNTGGKTNFNGAVGSNQALARLTTDANGATALP